MSAPSDSREGLTSWTRTLNEEDAQTLLDAAQPGLPLEAWRALGHSLLPQAVAYRRNDHLRLVGRWLLDHDGGVIHASRFLSLFQEGSPHRRDTLLRGRHLWHQPLVHRALEELVGPAHERAVGFLAPLDAARIPADAWEGALQRWLLPETPAVARRKTLTTLQRALALAGVIEMAADNSRDATACRGRPDPVGFGWLLAFELNERGLTEVDDPWAERTSFAARLFAPVAGVASTCVRAAVDAGLLRRGHLMGRARLHPGSLT